MAKKSDLQRRVLIGRKLAMARDMAQLRQEDVALEIFGTPHKNRMSEIENGKLMPDAELLSVLKEVYESSPKITWQGLVDQVGEELSCEMILKTSQKFKHGVVLLFRALKKEWQLQKQI